MLISVGGLVILAISLSNGAPMSDRCGPHQFEASVTATGGYVVKGQEKAIDYKGKTYYDYDRKMTRSDLTFYDATTHMEYQTTTYTDYNKHMQYTVAEGKCSVANYTAAMSPPCLPANATLLGSAVIGSQTHNMEVDTYRYYNAEFDSDIDVTVTKNDGTLISQSLNPVSGSSQQNQMFSDLVHSIRNKSVFALPASCMTLTG